MVIIFVSNTVHVLITMAVILVNVIMDMKVMAEQNVTTSMNVLEESENAVNSHCALIKKVGFKLHSYRLKKMEFWNFNNSFSNFPSVLVFVTSNFI